MNTLQERRNIEIEAWFSEFRSADWLVNPDQWRFQSQMLPPGPRRAVRSIDPLRRHKPDVLVTRYGDYAFVPAILAAKVERTPVVIHALRTFASWRRRSVIREVAKHALFRIADAVQGSGPDSHAYAEVYRAAPSCICATREELDIPFWTPAADTRKSGKRGVLSAHEALVSVAAGAIAALIGPPSAIWALVYLNVGLSFVPLVVAAMTRRRDVFEPVHLFALVFFILFVARPLADVMSPDGFFWLGYSVEATYDDALVAAAIGSSLFYVGLLRVARPADRAVMVPFPIIALHS